MGQRSAVNVRQSIIWNESIQRENAAREQWTEKFGKEYGMGKKIEKKMEAKKTRKLPESQQARTSKKKPQAEEEPEETRPLSLVYNQERYPAHYDLSRWNDLAINFGYKAFSF